jgi:Tfp pilus assembly protein PilW
MSRAGILKNASGLCLTELMIAMTAGAIVLAASLESLDHFQRRMVAQQNLLVRQQDVRLGMRVLEAELRLAGSGGPPTAAPLLQAGPQAIEFLANLDGDATSLTKAVSAHERELLVVGGTNWPKGKRVWVCGEEQCAEGRLTRNGQAGRLSLAPGLSHRECRLRLESGPVLPGKGSDGNKESDAPSGRWGQYADWRGHVVSGAILG